MAERWPFDPPYTAADLPQLDRLHDLVGLGRGWRASDRRAQLEAELTLAPSTVPAVVGQLLARMDPDPVVCPECEQGKCGNCDGGAWDHELDAPTACLCIHRGP